MYPSWVIYENRISGIYVLKIFHNMSTPCRHDTHLKCIFVYSKNTSVTHGTQLEVVHMLFFSVQFMTAITEKC